MLKQWGYHIELELNDTTITEIKSFLKEWIYRIGALYMAASLPPSFRTLNKTHCSRIIEACVIPVRREMDIPFAIMIGVKRGTNPLLRIAGSTAGKVDIKTIEYLYARYPENKFMVTALVRENQHELCSVANKFRNVLLFGCWWF